MALIRDQTIHRATFAARADYLAKQNRDGWRQAQAIPRPGTDACREDFRALKVWSALRAYGSDASAKRLRETANWLHK